MNVGDGGWSAFMDAIRNKDNKSRLRKRGLAVLSVDVVLLLFCGVLMEFDL